MEKWQQAAELLSKGHYQRVGQILQVQQEAARRSGQLATAVFLAAAGQLCLTCLQFQAERELHQLGLNEALRREQELQQQIQAVLTLLSHQAPLETQADLEAAFNLPPTQSFLEGPEEPDSEIQQNLLQKIQRWLGFELASASGKDEAKAEPQYPQAEKEPASTAEMEKKFGSAANEQDMTPATSQLQEQDKSTLHLSQAETELLRAAIDNLTEPGQQAAESLPIIDPEALVLESQKARTALIEEEAEPEVSETSPEIELLQSVPGQKSPEPTVSQEFPLYSGLGNSQPHVVSRPGQSVQVSDDMPSLTVYCMGSFQLYQDEEPVDEWASGKGKSVFKYLVTHRQQPVAKEVLMDIFWPDSDPDAARNSLNVAIYGLRQALRKGRPHFHHVLFEDDRYLLNYDLHIWLDVDEFQHQLSAAQKLQQRGNMEAALRFYGACEALYRGEFLAEDRYEEWVIPYRRNLQDGYLRLLEQLSRYYLQQEAYANCITTCEKMLAVEPCREDAHRQLMRAYSRREQRYLALRQYHTCREALERELGVEPGQRTVELYEKIRRREPI